jgi:hypothetical protein
MEQAQGPAPGQVIMPQERRFLVGEREIVVRPLVIGDYERVAADLGAITQRIIREHPEIELTRLDEHLEALLPIIAEWLGRILERLFGVEESYLKEHLTLAQATEIVAAALEINQLPVIRGNLQRALQIARARTS